jgi:hypothetical protein
MIAFRGIASLLLAVAFACAAHAQDDSALTDLDRRVLQQLTAVRSTPRAVFHCRPGAFADAALDADVKANVAALEQLERTLAMRYRGVVHVFLYADGDEMKRLTGAGDGTVAFSTGTVSVHQPHDFRGVHEFVHIYALQFERKPDTAGPDLFATEGLATWLAESDENVPIDAWAATYAKAGALPELLALRRTFPDGAPRGVHPYHVAGSFVGFLLQRFGMAKTKQWYMDSTEAHRWFGAGMAQLQREWREHLATVKVDPAHERHVLAKLGRGGEPIPAAWAKAAVTQLFDGKTLQGLAAEDAAKWTVKDGVLVCSNDAPWTHLSTARTFAAPLGVRARLCLRSGNAVKLRLPGGKEAIFAAWSSFASSGDGYAGNDAVKITAGAPVELIAANDGGRARVWLNGVNVFDLPGAWPTDGDGALALGVERGVVEVTEWSTFALR